MPQLILPHRMLFVLFLVALVSVGCSGNPFAPSTPLPPNTLTYDAPVSLTIKTDTVLPGTSIAYGGKTTAGAGKVLLAGLVAPKQVGDSVDWQGAPIPDVNVKLSLRVATFSDTSITLIGTSHIEISNVTIQPGGAPGTPLMEFSAPVSLSLNKNDSIPGSNLLYGGSTADGAQFLGLSGYPYRKALDSLQYVGRINPHVFLKLDLRVLSYSDSSVVLGGTATITLESP